jgi:ATP synthase protein I
MKTYKKKKKQFDKFIRYSGMGSQMMIIITAGVFGGYKIDTWMDNKFPVFLILLTTIAFFAAIYTAIKDFLK